MKYGQTWWGNEWLHALSNIDYSNRLPRGRAYANKGAVLSVDINDCTIHAKVSGSRRTPYKVRIDVPAFSSKQKKVLLDAITSNPLLLSKLLNRKLPHSLNQIASENQIKIFPSAWNDLQMECSCPDWAVPCKHLAAVINVISNEIDRNPFVVFQLHGFDIIRELKNAGMFTVSDTVKIPSITDLPAIYNSEPMQKLEIEQALERIDFSVMDDMRDNLLSLLEPSPLFYQKDFKQEIGKIYSKTARYATRYMKLLTTGDGDEMLNYEKYYKAEIFIDNGIFFSHCCLYESQEQSLTIKSTGRLVDFLFEIPAKYVSRLSPDLLLLYFSCHFSQKLAENSAYTPQLLKLTDNSYAIRWIPAYLSERIKQIFQLIVSVCNPNIIVTDKISASSDPQEQLTRLISIFIKHFIKEAGQDSALTQAPETCAFIDDSPFTVAELEQKETPGVIQRWIEKFYLSHNLFVPVLEVFEDEDSQEFSIDVLIDNREKPFDEPVELKSVMTEKKYENNRTEILRNLDLLSKAFPALEDIIASSGKLIPTFSAEEFAEVLLKILPVVKLHGIKVILPKALKELVRPQVSVSLSSSPASNGKSFMKLDDILDFQWKIALGDTVVDQDEFWDMVEGMSGIVKLKEQYVHLDQAQLKALVDNISKQKDLSRHQLLQAAVSGEHQGAKISIDEKTQQLIDSLLKEKDIELPSDLRAELRPYQKRGYDWLYRNVQLGFGSIIADDMGLGKTLQVIAAILKLKKEGALKKQKALVVVPTTLLTNWQKEIEKFAPEITFSVFHGPKRQLDMEQDVVITSYGIARSDSALLSKTTWKAVVIDEAQNIKNASTAQTKAIKKLKTGIRIAMSGTPVENRLSEYWSIFDFVNKGYLGTAKHFAGEFANPIEQMRNKEKLDLFLKITSPFILRRLKSDKSIIKDLPDKIETDCFTSLSKEQTAIYTNVLNSIMKEIEDASMDEDGGNIQRRGLVLKLIMSLKQICNHPSQFLKKEEFSPSLSGKAEHFIDLIDNIIESDEKVLVFTQFREMGEILQKMVKERFDTDAMFLHGGTSRKKRDEMVEAFQNNAHQKIFILSIKAAGTGLNLTAANHVIHYDLWWNPAVEAQATDRAYRIGQNKNVMVYRLITKGTFEEKINQMLTDKKELAELTVSSGEKWVGDLPTNDLKELFSL